jgi:choline dehydrogenase-like flavoprotein
MKKIKTDFLIVGSGFGAAAPALRLCKEGHKVLMIEKGKYIKGKEDFKQTQDPKYIQQYVKGLSGENINFTYAEGLGGGSGFYEMVSLRAPSMTFNQKMADGQALWPQSLDRKALDPWYDISEAMLNVSQVPIEKVPKSGVAFSMLMNNLGYSCDRARYAVVNCMGSGFCITGCVFGAKQSLHYNYIPQAQEHGLNIMSDVEAEEVLKLSGASIYNYAVNCVQDGAKIRIYAKSLILAAGTVGTAKLLLRSKKNLANISKQLGKNICFNGGVKVAGILPDDFIEGDMFSGMSHPGMISYQFLKQRGITVSSAKPLPIYLTGTNQFNIKGESRDKFWGSSNVKMMEKCRRKMIVLYALGYSPQTAEINIDGKGRIKPNLELTAALRRYYSDTKDLLHSIFERNNCKVLEDQSFDSDWKERGDIKFSTAHMTGSCRMGESIETGVVDMAGEVFNYPGMYITDGSTIPSSLAVNTSLTILANAERISDTIVRKYS